MKHLWVTGKGTYEVRETEKPTIEAASDVIVKITKSAMCGSDVHLAEGHIGPGKDYPLGHEYVGIVEEVGEGVENFKVGDRVAGKPEATSGTNDAFGIFGSGYPGYGGALAEYLRVPYGDRTLTAIPDGVTDVQALAVGDILSTGWTAMRHAIDGRAGVTILVQGCGPIGLAAINTAKVSGAAVVIASDMMADRLELAKQLGADYVINSAEENLVERVGEITDGRGVDGIVEAAGVKATIDVWPDVLGNDGCIGMVAIPAGPVEVRLADLLNKRTKLWVGLGAVHRSNDLMRLLAIGAIDPTPIFTHTYDFADVEQALDDMINRKPGLIKPVINIA